MSVYFAKVHRYIKVGHSDNPKRRVARLFQSSTRYDRPWDMPLEAGRDLLLTIPGTLSTEAMCHDRLADYAAGCEWFIDEPGVREFMAHAERGEFPTMARPGGYFEPVEHFDMPQARHDEMRQWYASRGKAYRPQTREEAAASLARVSAAFSAAIHNAKKDAA